MWKSLKLNYNEVGLKMHIMLVNCKRRLTSFYEENCKEIKIPSKIQENFGNTVNDLTSVWGAL